MEFLYEYGLFFAKAATFLVAIVLGLGIVLAMGQRHRDEEDGYVEVRHLNERQQRIGDALKAVLDDADSLKNEHKAREKSEKKALKEKKKQRKAGDEVAHKKRLFVLEFDGDIKASGCDNLREEISAILPRIEEGDSVLVKLESPGGMVHSYGLASSQLQRIVDAGVPLTVAVDQVAASGGYMMACVAQRIIAAPFAVIGSIGVVAQLPNFHRLLKKNAVDFEILTAGEFKRTLTMFGENTDKGREKFVEELEDTHTLFKDYVSSRRPDLDIAAVATGETWYGSQAVEKGLIDAVQTSEAFIQEQLKEQDVYSVKWAHKKSWQERLGVAAEGALTRVFWRVWQQGQQHRNY